MREVIRCREMCIIPLKPLLISSFLLPLPHWESLLPCPILVLCFLFNAVPSEQKSASDHGVLQPGNFLLTQLPCSLAGCGSSLRVPACLVHFPALDTCMTQLYSPVAPTACLIVQDSCTPLIAASFVLSFSKFSNQQCASEFVSACNTF